MNSVFSQQSRALSGAGRLAAFFLILLVITASAAESAKTPPIANFTDIAEKAGLTMLNVFGGKDTKKYIIETTGTGVAIFDYDNDGWPDIFLVNGTTLEGSPAGKPAPSNHLYRNNHDGTFTDVTAKAGLTATGGVRASASETTTTTDGKTSTSLTTAKNRLYHNQSGVFTEVADTVRRRRNRESLGHRMRLRRLRP